MSDAKKANEQKNDSFQTTSSVRWYLLTADKLAPYRIYREKTEFE